MENTHTTIQEYLQGLVDRIAERVEKEGHSTISVCSASHYGWDKDEWNYRGDIMDALINRGYNVSSSVNHEVTDILIKKKIILS